MAGPGKIATSFDDIIQAGKSLIVLSQLQMILISPADRQKRKAQKLATEIFGQRNRRASAPGAGAIASRKAAPIPSLASRVGISKVTFLSTSVEQKR
jgi:hypothetical protein